MGRGKGPSAGSTAAIRTASSPLREGGGVWMGLESMEAVGGSCAKGLSNSSTSDTMALVWVRANETMRSLEALERRLGSLGWERYYENRDLVQLHRRDGGVDLIALPRDFARFRSTHMYDVVVKNRHHFKVVDIV
ncbi:hypothetical protein TRIUR3_10752 [Triticum urartu]|uniref:Flowering-promoting factor 1-like protein 3 n=1 Tax=Triticum urartu TaxID=4572 RepID=M7ZPS3_TRIUA|nr:hypothetical protein TRIUR3_10752 [Triticum urartu]